MLQRLKGKKSICLGLVNEKIDFCSGWSSKKSTFFGLVSEKINFVWSWSATKSPFFWMVSEKNIFFGVRALIRAFFLGGPLPLCLIDWN